MIKIAWNVQDIIMSDAQNVIKTLIQMKNLFVENVQMIFIVLNVFKVNVQNVKINSF